MYVAVLFSSNIASGLALRYGAVLDYADSGLIYVTNSCIKEENVWNSV